MALTIVNQWSSFLEWVPKLGSPTLVPPGIGYILPGQLSPLKLCRARMKGSMSDVATLCPWEDL